MWNCFVKCWSPTKWAMNMQWHSHLTWQGVAGPLMMAKGETVVCPCNHRPPNTHRWNHHWILKFRSCVLTQQWETSTDVKWKAWNVQEATTTATAMPIRSPRDGGFSGGAAVITSEAGGHCTFKSPENLVLRILQIFLFRCFFFPPCFTLSTCQYLLSTLPTRCIYIWTIAQGTK